MKKLLLFLALLPLVATAQLTAISVNLYKDTILMDGVAVFYNGQSDAVDNIDIPKLTNPGLNIAITTGSDTLAGEFRTSYQNVNLRIWNLTPGVEYRLQIVTRNISTAFLIDSFTYKYVGDSLNYQFEPQKNATNRFKIAFCPVLSIGNEIVPVLSGKQGLRLFPNPATSYINLEMIKMPAGKYTISIPGSKFATQFVHTKDCIHRMDLSALRPGTYFLLIQNEQGYKNMKQILVAQ
jgi:hypothetical protein